MNTYSLYVKTHKKTGLNYLGFTKQDPFAYQGSGVYWCDHLTKHGYDVETRVIQRCYTKSAIKAWGAFYSSLWSVVKSNQWANLKPEEGEGGSPPSLSKPMRVKLSKLYKGKKRSQEDINAMRAGWKRLRENGYKPWNYGKKGFKGPCQQITLISPTGNLHSYESMKQACRENGLIYTKMSNVKNGKASHHHGWKILIEENQNY